MILVIDNYDSFTYNLVQYFGELGADPLVRRNDEITLEEITAMAPERICISPGPCTPKEAGISNDVIRKFSGHLPGHTLLCNNGSLSLVVFRFLRKYKC